MGRNPFSSRLLCIAFKLSPEASALLERSERTVARLTLFVPEA